MSQDLETLRRKEKRELGKLRKELRPALDLVLSNEDGFARLRAITDEEWQAAIDAEEQGGP